MSRYKEVNLGNPNRARSPSTQVQFIFDADLQSGEVTFRFGGEPFSDVSSERLAVVLQEIAEVSIAAIEVLCSGGIRQ